MDQNTDKQDGRPKSRIDYNFHRSTLGARRVPSNDPSLRRYGTPDDLRKSMQERFPQRNNGPYQMPEQKVLDRRRNQMPSRTDSKTIPLAPRLETMDPSTSTRRTIGQIRQEPLLRRKNPYERIQLDINEGNREREREIVQQEAMEAKQRAAQQRIEEQRQQAQLHEQMLRQKQLELAQQEEQIRIRQQQTFERENAIRQEEERRRRAEQERLQQEAYQREQLQIAQRQDMERQQLQQAEMQMQQQLQQQQEHAQLHQQALQLQQHLQQQHAQSQTQQQLQQQNQGPVQQSPQEQVQSNMQQVQQQQGLDPKSQQPVQIEQSQEQAGAASSSNAPVADTRPYLEIANEIIQKSEALWESCRVIRDEASGKQVRVKVMKVVNKRIGQISAVARKIEGVAEELNDLLYSLQGEEATKYFSLCKVVFGFVETAENIQAKPDGTDAWPIAHACARIINKHKEIYEIFQGEIYKKCRYLIPDKDEAVYNDQADEESAFRLSTGYTRLWFALLVLRQDYVSLWGWWARVLNKPIRRNTISIIVAALEMSGNTMQEKFGKQWMKLVKYIEKEILKQCEELRKTQPALISAVIPRIVKWLELYGKGQKVPVPAGRVIQGGDELELRADV